MATAHKLIRNAFAQDSVVVSSFTSGDKWPGDTCNAELSSKDPDVRLPAVDTLHSVVDGNEYVFEQESPLDDQTIVKAFAEFLLHESANDLTNQEGGTCNSNEDQRHSNCIETEVSEAATDLDEVEMKREAAVVVQMLDEVDQRLVAPHEFLEDADEFFDPRVCEQLTHQPYLLQSYCSSPLTLSLTVTNYTQVEQVLENKLRSHSSFQGADEDSCKDHDRKKRKSRKKHKKHGKQELDKPGGDTGMQRNRRDRRERKRVKKRMHKLLRDLIPKLNSPMSHQHAQQFIPRSNAIQAKLMDAKTAGYVQEDLEVAQQTKALALVQQQVLELAELMEYRENEAQATNAARAQAEVQAELGLAAAQWRQQERIKIETDVAQAMTSQLLEAEDIFEQQRVMLAGEAHSVAAEKDTANANITVLKDAVAAQTRNLQLERAAKEYVPRTTHHDHDHAPCTMHHAPLIMHAPCTMHHAPCTMHHAPRSNTTC